MLDKPRFDVFHRIRISLNRAHNPGRQFWIWVYFQPGLFLVGSVNVARVGGVKRTEGRELARIGRHGAGKFYASLMGRLGGILKI